MAIQFVFDKDRALHFLECVRNRTPITYPNGEWDANDRLLIAAANFFAVLDAFEAPKSLHSEHVEAMQLDLRQDLLTAINWCAMAMNLLQTDKYDQSFDPQCVVEVVAEEGGDGRYITGRILKGDRKNPPESEKPDPRD